MTFSTLLLLHLATADAGSLAPADTARPARERWYVPSHLLVHTAGGQGLAAVGTGWTANHNHLALEAVAGYLPKKFSITPIGIFTAKATYTPWQLAVRSTPWRVQPLALGGFVSYSASRGINQTRGSKYDAGYYWWSSRTRVGAFLGGSAGRAFRPTKRGTARTAMAYYELGTNDLYLVSWVNGRGKLPISSILTLGFGVRVQAW
ncbi:hypothetical protein I2I05_18275 [Hymenobacter sp. BT683]|uniref:Outer membrane protein beta-barrel domain-containing protein n=1 Tax=Hymenobacter jeongseonensis TaxID=2791027 RepID=A0ABS0INJ3_9BACT|nr:hypothetical protein [Hymenobacter jeongseonensis]MBF9239345.1 hypothetical protein [Hymenobacter jeongseonensis]